MSTIDTVQPDVEPDAVEPRAPRAPRRAVRLALLAVAAFVFVFHLRVVLSEEPGLARTHGEKWLHYKARVPRWLGWRSA